MEENLHATDLKLHGMRRRVDCAGRILIPASIKEDVGINPGDEVEIFAVGDNEGIYIRPVTKKEGTK